MNQNSTVIATLAKSCAGMIINTAIIDQVNPDNWLNYRDQLYYTSASEICGVSFYLGFLTS
jgi:hypothetical protein